MLSYDEGKRRAWKSNSDDCEYVIGGIGRGGGYGLVVEERQSVF